MYPSLSSLGAPGPSSAPAANPAYSAYDVAGARQRPAGQPQPGSDASPWGHEGTTMLRVQIADEFKLAPPVQVPAALQASSSQQKDYSFDFERKVMQEEGASKSLESFLQKPETSYYADTRAEKFLAMGFPVGAVHLAMAYRASQGGDDNQVRDCFKVILDCFKIVEFCNNYTQLIGMGFGPSLAAGALVKTKNDVSAATDLCLSINS